MSLSCIEGEQINAFNNVLFIDKAKEQIHENLWMNKCDNNLSFEVHMNEEAKPFKFK